MKLFVDVQRFDPRSDERPRMERYEIEAEATDRLLDVLLGIRSRQDPSLSFRHSSAHGVCGSDAMRINGRELLRRVAQEREKRGETVKDAPGKEA